MALSDSLNQLAAQAKSVETSAAAVEAEDGTAVTARLESLEASIESAKNAFGDELVAAGGPGRSRLGREQEERLRCVRVAAQEGRRPARAAPGAAGRARGDFAAADAADAVDFAIYAIQEAEYAVLQAAVARKDADELGAS
ncbi:MAG: hypothetical protein WDM88_12915 [Galbitalea sp.]